MLSNIIDRSDRTDHFDRIIPIQVIEICRQFILLFAWPKRGYEALRFLVSQRKTTSLESVTQVVPKKSRPKRLTKPRGAWQYIILDNL